MNPTPAWLLSLTVSCTLLMPAPAGADPNFEDATATHLVLPTGVASDDPFEKDMALADFDQDGDVDVFVVRKEPFSVQGPETDVLFLNDNGKLVGTQGLIPSITTDARDAAAADLNGDGWVDLVIANTFGQAPRLYWNLGNHPTTGVWLGFEDSEQTTGATFPASGNLPVNLNISTGGTGGIEFCAVTAGDLDNDGDIDLFFANYNSNATHDHRNVFLQNPGGTDPVFVDVSGAQLGDMQGFQHSRRFGTGAEIVDMDGDTLADIVMSEAHGNRLALNDSLAQGDFTNVVPLELPQNSQPLPNTAYMMTTGDFDGDTTLDQYLVTDGEDQVNITTSTNPYAMDTSHTVAIASLGFGGNAHAADVDGDGYLDVAVANVDVDIKNCPGDEGPLAPFLLLGNPDGTGEMVPWSASLPITPVAELAVHDFAFMDVNGDSCLDIFMGLCSGWRVFLQSSAGCLDVDSDGILDTDDNCVSVANNAQTDADLDGYGNRCDGDFDQSGRVTISDFNVYKACFNKEVPAIPPPECPAGPDPGNPGDPTCNRDPTCDESDMNDTGRVTIADLNIWINEQFNNPPGPSGLACAQDPHAIVTPCTASQ